MLFRATCDLACHRASAVVGYWPARRRIAVSRLRSGPEVELREPLWSNLLGIFTPLASPAPRSAFRVRTGCALLLRMIVPALPRHPASQPLCSCSAGAVLA